MTASPAPVRSFYVSIGDSYAAGYQPTDNGGIGRANSNGFAYQLAASDPGGRHLRLVNFGCGGATSLSLLSVKGCPSQVLGPGAPTYPNQTQARAALEFIAAHQAQIGLVTVIIGLNDVDACARGGEFLRCVGRPLVKLKANLQNFLVQLRGAAGTGVPIIGLTYPDVRLGAYTARDATGHKLAADSVDAFRRLINPALAGAYSVVGARFVDVTAGTGAYTPWNRTTRVAPFGKVPVAVADACRFTYYCAFQDIHPRTAGYRRMAELISAELKG